MMKQVFLSLKNGETTVEDVPIPILREGGVLVDNHFSVISGGTENYLLQLGGSSYIGKAKQKPDMFMKVVQMAKKQGPLVAYQQAMGRLNKPEPLGYSSAGIVRKASEDSPFKKGDRVACGGTGYANHADIVFVPNNLTVKVPDNVSLKDAAFTTIGSIAMQGFRNAKVNLGERVVVIGLGLIGLITVQILKAAGCKVFGTDIDPEKVKMGLKLGMDAGIERSQATIEEQIMAFSEGNGADAVIITAATKSKDPLIFAGNVSKQKGKVVLVGVVGMEIPRDIYYPKELEFIISCSYGPGRYDKEYEEEGHDYPYGYVRWTEKRNMESFLELLSEKKIVLDDIITHSFKINKAPKAYDIIKGETKEPYLGIVLEYEKKKDEKNVIPIKQDIKKHEGEIGIGWIGAGVFATSVLLKEMTNINGVKLIGLSAASGLSSKSAGENFGFKYVTTDYKNLLKDKEIDAIVIATRNSLHAPIAIEALEYGKHVFVEKPLAITKDELKTLKKTNKKYPDKIIHVGFNRRHAPLSIKVKKYFDGRKGPMMMMYRTNGEHIPLNHWVFDDKEGGSRFITELCHFVDFAKYMIGSEIIDHSYFTVESNSMKPKQMKENLVMNLKFKDGSIATIVYNTIGDPSFSKEYCEIYSENAYASITDFKEATMSHNGKSKSMKDRLKSDKGHRGNLQAFIDNIKNGNNPFEEWIDTTEVTLS